MKDSFQFRNCFLCINLLVLFIVNQSSAQVSENDTLEVVNWNLEWFGSSSSQLPEEMTKTRTIMNKLNADVYALVEVVNKDSLQSLVLSLDGNYNYLISPFGSFANSPSDPSWQSAQKLALVYRQSMVRNVKGRAMLRNSSGAYYNWSSGRLPYFLSAEILGSDGQWQPLNFIIIHAKAYSDSSSCSRRYYGAKELKDTLDKYYANERLIILGDFNDDLDTTMCTYYTESNYIDFVKDSTDANSYRSLTLPLSKTGISSIDGFPHFLDHFIVSNEVAPYYVPGSAELLKDKVKSWVTDYTKYVSDHYPVLTKYIFTKTTDASPVNTRGNIKIYPNPATDYLFIEDPQNEMRSCTFYSMDGRKVLEREIGTSISLQQFNSGWYIVKFTDKKGHVFIERICFEKRQ